MGAVAVFFDFGFTHVFDGVFDQIADDGIHITTDITDFGEFGGFNFNERRIGQAGQTAGNFGFTHAGWAYHQDVFWHDFCAQRLIHQAAAVAVAQGHGHGALRRMLANDVFV